MQREGPMMPARKPTKSRAEKAVENRARLIDAAQQVVGEYGYAQASVSRIVQQAELAQGTFYLYFESRQDLFDHLLPEVGDKAFAYIREAVAGAATFVDMEERGLRAFFEYAAANPSYFRIVSEAEVAAPSAYRQYTEKRDSMFLRAVTAAWRRGEITGYSRRELGVITQMMIAARAYLFHGYARTPKGVKVPPDWVIDSYLNFVRAGLRGRPLKQTAVVAPDEATRSNGKTGSGRVRLGS